MNSFKRQLIILPMFFLALIFSIQATAQFAKSELNHSKEIIPNDDLQSKVIGNQRVETKTGISRAIYNPRVKVMAAEPQTMAEQYLMGNATSLLRKTGTDDIEFQRTIETPGGYKVHFAQTAEGYPVYGSTINVSINRENEVVFVTNSYKPLGELNSTINISQETATQFALVHTGITGKLSFEKVETVVYNIDLSKSVIAHKINLVPAENNFGDWEILVDASNGTILRAEDKACYHHPDGDNETGSGWVFDPDPTTNAKKAYANTGFIDSGDADNDSLTAQLKEVVLNDISFDGTNYKLEGTYAAIIDVEAPYTGLYEQDSSNFHFTRSQKAFEATNIYYHVDHSMRYLHETLGFEVWPYQYEGGVHFDPHGLNDGVNAWYTSGGYIAFGSPPSNVDAGEDHAIVLHELGHGIHNWITNGGGSQVNGLGEGNGDYWAQSYTRSLGIYQPEDDAYDWFGVWGLQPIQQGPTLRVTNFPGHYPEDLTGQVHNDGRLWSSSLMSIYDQIGKTPTDMNFWECNSMLNGQSNQIDAAMAFMQADNDLYDGVHMEEIYQVFFDRGYISDPVAVSFTADQSAGEGPLTVNFSDESLSFLGEINSWEWDLDGDGEVDSYDENPTFTYEEVGAYTVSLKVSDGENVNTLVKPNYITVNGGFFVFEKAENARDYSGTYIRDFLEARGHSVLYSNYYPSSFKGFDAIFISFGNYGSGFTIMDDEMAQAMTDYMMEGGNVYFESASTLGYFQNGNTTLLELFGLTNAAPVGNNNINELTGQTGTLTEGLTFSSSNQTAVNFIEQYVPDATEGSMVTFNESNYGNVAVQNTGDVYGQNTFCFAYALSELNDETPESSRNSFMVKLMDFFGFPELDNYVVAEFDADHSSVLPGTDLQFSDWSFSAPGTTITSWEWDFDMDGTIDATEQNPTHTYNTGGIYDVMLVVSNGIVTDTLIKDDYIAVRSGVLVYDGKMGVDGYSGSFINEYLLANWYPEVGYTDKLPDNLNDYDVVFLSFGNAGNQKTEVSSEMANIIESYGMNGGKIFIDGGDAFSDAKSIWLVFGMSEVMNGSNKALQMMEGQSGSIVEGITFDASSQFSNSSIDQYTKIGDVPVIKDAFTESDYGSVAVEFDGTELFGQKTFCMSYALSELEDGEGINTRNEVLSRILNFFDVVAEVDEYVLTEDRLLNLYPNPAKDQVTLSLSLDNEGPVDIILYDFSGRQISTMSAVYSKENNQLTIKTQHLTSGLYYFNVRSAEYNETIKWLKID